MNHKSSMIVIEVPIELLGLSNAEYISCLGLGLGLKTDLTRDRI